VETVTPISRPEAAPSDRGALTMKHQLILAMQQGLNEPIHISNSGIGPGASAWGHARCRRPVLRRRRRQARTCRPGSRVGCAHRGSA
jgi:hypothetical protein